MKTLYKNLLYAASGAMLCLFLAVPASAQRPSGGGGGGGSHPSGGSSTPSARPSGGSSSGSASVSRPAPSSSNVSRPSVGVSQRGVSAPPRTNGNVYRQGVAVRGNGNVGYAPRTGIAVRGNYGSAPRAGVVPGNTYAAHSYRTAPRVGYGNGSYWSNHGYYHYNRGYYNSYYGVNLGYRCRILPYGYYPFFWGDDQYYFCNGLFYTYDNENYTVVEPPVGAEVTTLPENAKSIVINGEAYFECNGVYYQAVTKDDGTTVYMVAGKDGVLNTDASVQDDQPRGPQMGGIVTQLPQDCRKIKVSGQKLWVSPDGVYYQEQVDANGQKAYKVVGLPSDEPEQQ